MVTKELLHELFEYRNGELYWKINKKFHPNLIGKQATFIDRKYKGIMINGKKYLAHRIIYMYYYGKFPLETDHIDRNPLNNNIENLREVNRSQNQWNKGKSKSNTSGCSNVTWCKRKNKWKVHLMVHKVMKNLGYFDDIKLADLVAQEARSKYHGNFANHG